MHSVQYSSTSMLSTYANNLTAIQLVIKALIEHSKEEQEELMVQLREERAARAEQAIIERQKAEEEAQRQREEEERQKKVAFELEVQRSMSGGASGCGEAGGGA